MEGGWAGCFCHLVSVGLALHPTLHPAGLTGERPSVSSQNGQRETGCFRSARRCAAKTYVTCQVVSFFAPPSVLWADMSPGPPVPAPGPGPAVPAPPDSQGHTASAAVPAQHTLSASTTGSNRESKKPGTGSTSGTHML